MAHKPRQGLGSHKPQGLCSHPAHLWATSDSAPRCERWGSHKAAVAGVGGAKRWGFHWPTCGPLPILPPAVKRWGSPQVRQWQGLVCPPPRWGTIAMLPPGPLVGRHLAHLWATSDSAPRCEAVGIPQAAVAYVATRKWPTCGPLLILPPAVKRWGSHKRQGLCIPPPGPLVGHFAPRLKRGPHKCGRGGSRPTWGFCPPLVEALGDPTSPQVGLCGYTPVKVGYGSGCVAAHLGHFAPRLK